MARFVSYTKCTLCRAFFQFVDAYRLQQEAGLLVASAWATQASSHRSTPLPPSGVGVFGERPPLREVQVYTGSSSGLTINLPLKAPLPPLRG